MKLNTKLLFLFLIISSHFVLTMDKAFFQKELVHTGQRITEAKTLEKIKCKSCSISFFPEYLDYLKHHIYVFHVISKTCIDCNINFIEPEDFVDHLKIYHNEKIQIPEHPSLSERKELNIQIAKHLPEMKFECPLCSDLYPTEQLLNKHYTKIHGSKAASEEIHYDPENLEDAKLLREFSTSIVEDIQDDSEVKVDKLDSKKTSTIPYTLHSELSDYQCQFPECTHQCKTNPRLREHILRIHVKIKPYICPVCDKRFYTISETEDHVAKDHTHEAARPISKISVEIQQMIDKEIDKYMPGLPFKCDKCPRSYINRRSLISHVNTGHLIRPRLQEQETMTRPASNKRPLTNATALPDKADKSLKGEFIIQLQTRNFRFIDQSKERSGSLK